MSCTVCLAEAEELIGESGNDALNGDGEGDGDVEEADGMQEGMSGSDPLASDEKVVCFVNTNCQLFTSRRCLCPNRQTSQSLCLQKHQSRGQLKRLAVVFCSMVRFLLVR